MCFREIDTVWSCGHIETSPDGETFCLYGKERDLKINGKSLCDQVGHTHVIRHHQQKKCQQCHKADNQAQNGFTLQKDHELPKKRKAENFTDLLRRVIAADKLMAIMDAELAKILQMDLGPKQCKELLYVCLYQPKRYTNIPRLLHTFGKGVSGYFSYEWEKSMNQLAIRKGHKQGIKNGLFEDQKTRNKRRADFEAAKKAAEEKKAWIEEQNKLKKEVEQAKKNEEKERKYITIK